MDHWAVVRARDIPVSCDRIIRSDGIHGTDAGTEPATFARERVDSPRLGDVVVAGAVKAE